MIYLTVGSHFKPFDRLILEMDKIAGKHGLNVFAQIGPSKLQLKNMEYKNFISYEEAEQYIKQADLIITQGGFGAIMLANKYSKKTIIVPRNKKYNEVIDDHQFEICEVFLEEGKENFYIVKDISELEPTVISCLKNKSVVSKNNGKQNIINTIKAFVKENEK